jgi:hypothetical protein
MARGRLVFLFVTACAASGCAHQRVPARADIQLLNVAIAENKADGTAWDDFSPADEVLALAVPTSARLASTVPLASIAVATAEYARHRLRQAAPPDPFGSASVITDEGVRTVVLPQRRNTVEPEFGVRWDDVKLAPSTTMRLELRDADLSGDDLIGSIDLTYDDLVHAWRRGGACEIAVDDRSRQLRSVRLVVSPTAK